MIAAAALIAVGLSYGLVLLLRRYARPPTDASRVSVLGIYSPVLTRLKIAVPPSLQQARFSSLRSALQGNLGLILEIAVIGVWALWIGRNLLNFDPHVWPAGREFGFQVYGLHLWEQLRACGLCALWNGMLNGGAPFLSDPFTGALHPVPAAATLIAGVIGGAKITLVASFFLAGIGQWWIGRVIGLGRFSRVWTALVATGGAHLVSHVDVGSVSLPLSLAAVTLALASALDLGLNRTRKAALRFGVLLGLAFLAGHGYYQVALVFWAPWIALLILSPRNRLDLVWREYLLALGLALLLAGIFLVPFLHFWPEAVKFTDPAFKTSQPFEYIPLNLVIHDWEFLISPVLGKAPLPSLNALYIGWPAVVLAILALALGRMKDRRLLLSLSLGALSMMWLASGVPLRWLAGVVPMVAGFRHAAIMAGLAIPAVLAMAGYGLDRLAELRWPRLALGVRMGEAGSTRSVSAAWLLLVPFGAALHAADRLDQSFLASLDRSRVYESIGVMKTPDLQWVAMPGGEHFWVEPALDSGLKLTAVSTLWWWKDRELPAPRAEARRAALDGGTPICCQLDDLPVYRYPANEYATVENRTGTVPCSAQGSGGDLRVTCQTSGGRLVVQENAWTGWSAEVNGEEVALEEGQWLSVRVPSGPVEVRFRYFPPDVLIGALLTLTGIVLVVALWIRAGRSPAIPGGEERAPPC